MKNNNLKISCLPIVVFVLALLVSCSKEQSKGFSRYDYPNIVNIRFTPGSLSSSAKATGWFTDAGSWWGFTLASADNFVNGFCGPYQLDMNRREWFSKSIVEVDIDEQLKGNSDFKEDSVSYFPGELYMKSSCLNASVEQRLYFVSSNDVLLNVNSNENIIFKGLIEWGKKTFNKKPLSVSVIDNCLAVSDSTSEGFVLYFGEQAPSVVLDSLESNGVSYKEAIGKKKANVVISFFGDKRGVNDAIASAKDVYLSADKCIAQNLDRWNGYLKSVIRKDMPMEYNRIAAKAITTLIANWKCARGDLFHDGVVPSHGVGYFMGFWGWDSWKHAAALAKFAPQVAKDQVITMFDYQDTTGMIVDCIYSDESENNYRDSKPPLSVWAVDEIYKATLDSAFVRQMYPKLLKYYKWWFKYRDHNNNGICEYGSCDGTLEAAAWESGMDNAIRFDDAVMVDNGNGGWSVNQESVDLNAFLALEYRLLKELAPVAGYQFNEKGFDINVADYFFNKERGFFFDKRLDGTFVLEEGTEACIPLWAGIASKQQAEAAAKIFTDTCKFATFIPFPTIAADNPKFMPAGYWRGPIWLDQVYFGINGLRKYGYVQKADEFTRNVFDRLYGLKTDAPIHENYNTHNGGLLKAPNFSWSSAHLLMLYCELGKEL